MPEVQSIRLLFHSKGKMESLGLNSSSSQSRKKTGGGGGGVGGWGGGGGGGGGGTLGAVLASLLTRPEITCLFIEFLLVLRKLPSFHWVVILAIVCWVRCMKLQILISKLNFYYLIPYLTDERFPPGLPRFSASINLN